VGYGINGKACRDAKMISDFSAEPPLGGRFPDQPKNFPDVPI
jgi:hypothetical protein